MTPDQIYMRLAPAKGMRARLTGKGESRSTLDMMKQVGTDGKIPGRDADGKPIRAVIRGKSLARELMEREAERERKEREEEKRKRGGKRRSQSGN